MSPELCRGEAFSGQLADVWAVGATMFMLRFGHPPFVAGNIIHLYNKIQTDELVFPAQVRLESLVYVYVYMYAWCICMHGVCIYIIYMHICIHVLYIHVYIYVCICICCVCM